jgi:hypothetical protein
VPGRDSHSGRSGFIGKGGIALLAAQERDRIVAQDILGHPAVDMQPLAEDRAGEELIAFAEAVRGAPNMEDYFDQQHIVNLRAQRAEARHGFTTLREGGIVEVVQIPCLPDDVMGFHIFTVYDPGDAADLGRIIGYTVYSIEKGAAPFGRAEVVRLAFDIFPEFREGRYRKVPFTNHEIYNISRRLLFRYRPARFAVDAKTQIRQTRTGDRLKRVIYYIKRGYYPPDRKLLGDVCLVRLARDMPLRKTAVGRLMEESEAPFWIFPMR